MTLKIKQKWGFIFLVLVAAIYITIYSLDFVSTGQKVKEIYFADRVTAAHKILIEKYNKLNEGKLRVVPIDFPNFDFSTNERKELLARSLRGRGDGIDLFAVDLVWTRRFAKWCEPLDKYFPGTERARILHAALESCYYNGELVAIPLDLVQGVMYYREDLLLKQENGDKLIEKLKQNITWQEFIKLKKSIPGDNPYYIFPAADYEGLICSFMELVLSLRPNYFEEEGFNLNTPEAQRALQLLVDLVNKYELTPKIVTEFTEIPSYEYYIKNDAVFIRGWPSYDKDFEESPFNPGKEQHLRKAPLPHFEQGKPTSLFGGWNLMISKFSDKKEEAIDFIKFLITDEAQEIFYKEAGYYPVINSFYDDQLYIDRYPEAHEYKDLIKTGVHRPAHEEYTRYSEIMSHYFEMAIRNEISVKEALKESTTAIRFDQVITKKF
jgi:multiple sugar transport system substrate-binding protein